MRLFIIPFFAGFISASVMIDPNFDEKAFRGENIFKRWKSITDKRRNSARNSLTFENFPISELYNDLVFFQPLFK